MGLYCTNIYTAEVVFILKVVSVHMYYSMCPLLMSRAKLLVVQLHVPDSFECLIPPNYLRPLLEKQHNTFVCT